VVAGVRFAGRLPRRPHRSHRLLYGAVGQQEYDAGIRSAHQRRLRRNEDRITITVLKSESAFAADAGDDQIVQPGAVVTLSGDARGLTGDEEPTFQWTQVGGPSVQLDADNVAEVHFVAPQISGGDAVADLRAGGVQNGWLG